MIRTLLCRLGFCSCRTNSDGTHIWGECIHCGRRYGGVSREEVRRYLDRNVSELCEGCGDYHGPADSCAAALVDLPSAGEREWAKLHSYICEANLCPEGFRIDETTADVAIRLLKKHVPGRDSDRSGEAGETPQSGSTSGESAGLGEASPKLHDHISPDGG